MTNKEYREMFFAFKELSEYQTGRYDFITREIRADDPLNESDKQVALRQLENFISGFMGAQTVHEFFTNKSPNEFLDELILTPWKADGFKDLGIVKKVNKTGNLDYQGTPSLADSASEHYEVKDQFLLSDIKPIHVIQVCDPAYDPSQSSLRDITSLVMNGLPSLELSRAVPYLNIEVQTSQKRDSKFTLQMTSDRTILGPEDREGTYGEFIKSEVIGTTVDIQPQNDRTIKTISGLDIFTSPQTMVRHNSLGDHSSTSDPFRPLFSIENFTLTEHVPEFGLDPTASQVTGQLQIVLHDRTRIDDIKDLLRPGGFHEGRYLKITYGYAHPDAQHISRTSDANQAQFLYGKIINGLRRTDLFHATLINYAFRDAGEVLITLNLVSLSDSIHDADILGGFSEVSEEPGQLKDFYEKINTLKKLLSSLSKNEEYKKLGTSAFVETLTDLGKSGTDAKQLKIVNQKLRELIARLKNKRNNSNLPVKETLKLLESLESDSDQDAKNVTLKEASVIMKSKSAQMAEFFAVLEKTADPFLRKSSIEGVKINYAIDDSGKPKKLTTGPTADYIKRAGSKKQNLEWISLGKIILHILGRSIGKKMDAISETQFVFHGFNRFAGNMHDFNIAQMPLPYPKVKSILEDLMKNNFLVAASQCIGTVISLFVKGDKQPAYAFTNFSKETQSKEEVFEKVYGIRSYGSKFIVPDINIITKFVENRDTAGGDPILRVTLHDKAASATTPGTEIIKALEDNGIYYKQGQEPANELPKGGMKHSKNYDAIIKGLIANKVLLPLSGPLQEEIKKIRLDPEIKKNILQINLKAKDVIRYMRSVYPTIRYGASNTGIVKADVTSNGDHHEVAIALEALNKKQILEGTRNADTEEVATVFPSVCKLQTIGCPLFQAAQTYFMDFGTVSTIDYLYLVSTVAHSIRPGSFETSVDMISAGSYPTYASRGSALIALAKKIADQK